MYKAYKFRLIPNKNQITQIHKTFGCTRFIYNYFLNQRNESYKQKSKNKSAFDCCNEIKLLVKEKSFLKEVDSCALRSAIFDLDDAFKLFFQRVNKYPNFKKKYEKESYRTSNMTSEYKGSIYNSIKVDLENKIITLPKLKEIKIRGYRNLKQLNGRIINATVSKDSSERYYVSVLVEEATIIKENEKSSIIGIDLGIKNLITTSHGETIDNNKVLKKYEKRIKHIQKELSRKQKKSKNYYKLKKKLATLYRKVKNTRAYYLHNISKKLVKENKIIVTEKLRIKDMTKNPHLSKSILDASWYELIRQLEYKSKQNSTKFYQVEEYYASSQICHRCGNKNKKVKDLSVREYECGECGVKLDRDLNASINIMSRGLEFYLKDLKELSIA